MQYTGHVISVCITWERYCIAIDWNSGDVIRSILHIYEFSYKFDTVLHQFFETETSDRCLSHICNVQRQRFSGHILYPLSYFLYSPFGLQGRQNRHFGSKKCLRGTVVNRACTFSNILAFRNQLFVENNSISNLLGKSINF